MFCSKYLTIVAKNRTVMVTREDGDLRDEDGGCARIAIRISFSNLRYTVCWSSNVNPPPDTFSTLLFFRKKSTAKFFFKLKVCCKRWRRNRTSSPQLHVQDRRSRRTTIAFVKGQSVSKNYFSLCKNIVHLLRLFNVCLLLKRKNWCLWKISALFLHTIYSFGDR